MSPLRECLISEAFHRLERFLSIRGSSFSGFVVIMGGTGQAVMDERAARYGWMCDDTYPVSLLPTITSILLPPKFQLPIPFFLGIFSKLLRNWHPRVNIHFSS